MTLKFPDNFRWGTSSAAAQIETVFDHPWKDLKSQDGYVMNRTTDHELRRKEDADYIKQLGDFYRASVDWSKLQRAPFEDFHEETLQEYLDFFDDLKSDGTELMFVFHHFSHPNWFEEKGGWLKPENIPMFLDFAQRCIKYFSKYVFNWNTFNEPNVFAMNAYMLGNFPPFKKNYFKANKCVRVMGQAHDILYDILKESTPEIPVGISYNTAYFEALTFLGKLPAKFTDWWFMDKCAKYFEKVDYWGLSYYAHILFNPTPVTEADTPGELAKLGYKHDKMWAYKPEALRIILNRFYKKYKKPILITENGICSLDPKDRIMCLKDYLGECHKAIEEDGVELLGYTHWSTWDNFEWHLGPTFKFGLVSVDFDTMERTMTEAGLFYGEVAEKNEITI